MLGEIIVLALLLYVVLGFFIGFKEMTAVFIGIIVLICLCIVAGFFIGIGIHFFNYLMTHGGI